MIKTDFVFGLHDRFFSGDSAASSCIGVENQTIEPVFVGDCERDVKVEVCVL